LYYGAAFVATLVPGSAWAVDSYRWLRVSIDTPWAIFIFLLPMVLVPVVLMAILYWRFAFRGGAKQSQVPPADAALPQDDKTGN
jgi:hypothetical protein